MDHDHTTKAVSQPALKAPTGRAEASLGWLAPAAPLFAGLVLLTFFGGSLRPVDAVGAPGGRGDILTRCSWVTGQGLFSLR